jgi:hypothetical protein
MRFMIALLRLLMPLRADCVSQIRKTAMEELKKQKLPSDDDHKVALASSFMS